MTEEPSDRALCESVDLQAALLRYAYATGEATTIDHALIRVTNARRMMKNGLYELIYGDDPEDSDNAATPSDP
ncbi:hypothetical protein SLH49_20840 [Cognatiyoonia sp. IB215446]|uniref:hypothetical protein n=1 Tax=Cognatiyoonia sp. IB215446 TaxID=3097355 RepID=UPI002A0F9BFA|nr:hypothetical protein [Cognatiyoonia sp. IB215446]MDX8350443.1 hypothetical protein [Cognatiyoonia sp. IB215446]